MLGCGFKQSKTRCHSNSMVATSTDVSNMGGKSSSWYTPILPSNVMPHDKNDGVTMIILCLNVATSSLDTNHMVTMKTNIGNVGDKSRSLGTLFLPNNAMPLDKSHGVTTIKLHLNVATSNLK